MRQCHRVKLIHCRPWCGEVRACENILDVKERPLAILVFLTLKGLNPTFFHILSELLSS